MLSGGGELRWFRELGRNRAVRARGSAWRALRFTSVGNIVKARPSGACVSMNSRPTPLASPMHSATSVPRKLKICWPSASGAKPLPTSGTDRGSGATEHCVLHSGHRLQPGEAGELQDRAAERQQDAAQRGDHAAEDERVQLRLHHRDTQRGGRPLVGAHRDQASPGSRAPQVGDDQADQDQERSASSVA